MVTGSNLPQPRHKGTISRKTAGYSASRWGLAFCTLGTPVAAEKTMRRYIRSLLTPALTIVAMVVFLVEKLIIDDIKALGRLVSKLAIAQRVEAWIGRLPPYPALACFLIPVLLVLPFKFFALWLFSTGNVVTGILVLLTAKVTGTLIVTRIFHAASPALMTIRWFAATYRILMRGRAKLYAVVSAQRWWKSAERLVLVAHERLAGLRRAAAERLRRAITTLRRSQQPAPGSKSR